MPGVIVVLAALMTMGAVADAASPEPSPSPSAPVPAMVPAASVGIGEVTWGAVDGTAEPALGTTISEPGASMGAGSVITWTGGFAALGNGVWVSPDGRAWAGHPLPRAIDGPELSLLAWHDELLLVEQRVLERGWRFRLWASSDGQEWRRAGTFDQRPVGRLEGCAFTYQQVASTETRILAMANCVPYGNGGARSQVATIAGVTARRYPDAATWAWTSDDATHWARHLVTDRTDPAGAVRPPVLVEAIAEGFAAILCCYRPTLWWSDDGVSWSELGDLPETVAYQDVHALGVFVRNGRPETWLLFADKDHEIGEGGRYGALGTLWTGDGAAWAEVVGQPDWEDGRIATDGQVAVIGMIKVLDEDPETVRVDTITSTDGGRSWAVSEGEELTPDECCFGGIALHGDRAFLAGLWGPDGVTLRRSDVDGSVP
jgi:hypothetical protein